MKSPSRSRDHRGLHLKVVPGCPSWAWFVNAAPLGRSVCTAGSSVSVEEGTVRRFRSSGPCGIGWECLQPRHKGAPLFLEVENVHPPKPWVDCDTPPPSKHRVAVCYFFL